MAEVRPIGPMVGSQSPQQSTTIQAAKRAQLTVGIGTGLTFLIDHVDTINAFLTSVLPHDYLGMITAFIQLVTAVGTFWFGRQAIQGRVDATQRIAIVPKENSLHFFLIFGPPTVLLLLIFVGQALAAPTPITFKWQYTGITAPDGFRLYQGTSPAAVTSKVADIAGSAVRQFVYNRPDTDPMCYGISAFNGDGESAIVTQRADGTPMCLGKPAAPTAFSS